MAIEKKKVHSSQPPELRSIVTGTLLQDLNHSARVLLSIVNRKSSIPVPVHLPLLVVAQRLRHGVTIVAAIDGYMVLVAVLANVLQ